MKYREGSRIAVVYERFLAHGAPAAKRTAIKLGVSDDLCDKWLTKWATPLTRGGRVFACFDVDVHGTLMAVGPEQSEVRWDDGHTSNSIISNDDLRHAPDKAPSNDPREARRARARQRRALRRAMA